MDTDTINEWSQDIHEDELDEEPLTYCFGCGKTRLLSDMVDRETCIYCVAAETEEDGELRQEEIRKAENTLINVRALERLVRAHREEFDTYVTEERRKYESQ